MNRLPDSVTLTLEAGTWNVPTLSLVEHLASEEDPESMARWPEVRYLPDGVVNGWAEAKHDFQQREDSQPEAAQRLVERRQATPMGLPAARAPLLLGAHAPQLFD